MDRAYRRQLYEHESYETPTTGPFDILSRLIFLGKTRFAYIIALAIIIPGSYIGYERINGQDDSSLSNYAAMSVKPALATNNTASQMITRISQFDRAQYNSDEELATWRNSSCSAAALVAALNTRGNKVRITDVLARLGDTQISPRYGLLWPHSDGLASVARSFGVQADRRELNYADIELQTTLNNLVLVDIIDAQRFPGGHWILISHADDGGVNVTDSWPTNIQWLSKTDFSNVWRGNGVIIQ